MVPVLFNTTAVMGVVCYDLNYNRQLPTTTGNWYYSILGLAGLSCCRAVLRSCGFSCCRAVRFWVFLLSCSSSDLWGFLAVVLFFYSVPFSDLTSLSALWSTCALIVQNWLLLLIEGVHFSIPQTCEKLLCFDDFSKNMIPYCYSLLGNLSPGRRKHLSTWITIGFNNYWDIIYFLIILTYKLRHW